jgi:hypothetical protein
MSAGETRAEVVQVATPVVEFTAPVVGLLQAIGFPPVEKVTVPVGPLGVNVTPPTVAVRVTGVSTVVLAGDNVSIGLSLLMTWLTMATGVGTAL